MVIVNTLADIQKVKNNGTLDSAITKYLQECFLALSRQLSPETPPESVSLEKYGDIVFIQDESDCKNLSKVGLHGEYQGTFPEYVEQIRLQGGGGVIELYRACIVINNETCVTVLSQKGTLDYETERFLVRECG